MNNFLTFFNAWIFIFYRYFCSHKAGVHSVNLPMVAQLAELTQITDEAVAKGLLPSQLEQNSIVQHLVCTQVFSKNVAAPVQGLAVSFPPPKLHCILQDFKVWNSLKKTILPLFTHASHIWAHALQGPRKSGFNGFI